jgi:hypothetical protein
MSGSFKRFLFLRFSHQNPAYTTLSLIRVTWSAHRILLYMITRIIFGDDYRSWSSSFHSRVISSLWGQNVFLGIPFPNTLTVSFSRNISDKVSHIQVKV